MNSPLRRFIVWSVAVFVVLATGAVALGTAKAWGLRDGSYRASPVSRAEIVSMQPYVGAAPVILVAGPSGAEVKVRGTEDLGPPYPLEGDIDVVFLRSGGAVTSETDRRDQADFATGLIVAIWLGWCLAMTGALVGARYLLDMARPWWPQKPTRRPTRAQDADTRRRRGQDHPPNDAL